jgi:hypothetical protein
VRAQTLAHFLAIGVEFLRLPHLEEMPAADKGDLVGDPRMLANEVGHRDASVLVQFQERAIPVTEEGHVVGGAKKRIVLRQPRLVALQQIHPARVDRSHVDRLQRVEFAEPAFLQHAAKQGRHRNAPLGVDLVHRIGQKTVHAKHPSFPSR